MAFTALNALLLIDDGNYLSECVAMNINIILEINSYKDGVQHPYGLTQFEGMFFWTEFTDGYIKRFNSKTNESIDIKLESVPLFDLKLFQNTSQTGWLHSVWSNCKCSCYPNNFVDVTRIRQKYITQFGLIMKWYSGNDTVRIAPCSHPNSSLLFYSITVYPLSTIIPFNNLTVNLWKQDLHFLFVVLLSLTLWFKQIFF